MDRFIVICNLFIIAAFVVLAFVFNKWWIPLFAVLFMMIEDRDEEDEEES